MVWRLSAQYQKAHHERQKKRCFCIKQVKFLHQFETNHVQLQYMLKVQMKADTRGAHRYVDITANTAVWINTCWSDASMEK